MNPSIQAVLGSRRYDPKSDLKEGLPIVRSLLLILIVALALTAPTQATTLLFDGFDGSALDLRQRT